MNATSIASVTRTAPAPVVDQLERLPAEAVARFGSRRRLPPLVPVMAVDLIALTQVPRLDPVEVAEVFGRDPLLAARLLEMDEGRAASLESAARRIDKAALDALVLDIALNTRVLNAEGYTEALERLRVHSVLTARAARVVCRQLGRDPDQGFLAGLVHDIGAAAVLVTAVEAAAPAPLEQVWCVALAAHDAVGQRMLRRMGRPRLGAIVGGHHALVVAGRPDPDAAVVAVAERLANEIAPRVGSAPAVQPPGRDEPEAKKVLAACALLGIGKREWLAIRGAAEGCRDGAI